MNDYILTTTGFLLPSNNLYTRVIPDKNDIEHIFTRTQYYEKKSISNLFTNNEVYSSKVINDDLSKYLNDKSARNFYKLLDNCLEIFSETSLINFFLVQAKNSYLSNICYMFLIDFLEEINNYYLATSPLKNDNIYSYSANRINKYSYLPYNVRFNLTSKVSEDVKLKREEVITKFVKSIGYPYNLFSTSNTQIFTLLTKNKDFLLTFYKFVLADINFD